MLQLAVLKKHNHILILFVLKGYNHGGYIVFAFTKSFEANCGQVVADSAKMVYYSAVLARNGTFFERKKSPNARFNDFNLFQMKFKNTFACFRRNCLNLQIFLQK